MTPEQPTPEHLAELAARILAIMPRTGGRALDGAAVEVAMLLGELCKSSTAADRLADQLVRHPWRRWNFQEFRIVADRLAAAPPPEFTTARLKSHLVPDLLSDAEYEALYRRAVQAGLKFCGLDIPDVLEAEATARRESKAFFDNCPQPMREQLMEECRAEFLARMANTGSRNSRATEPPALDVNARDFAEARIYRYLVIDEPLLKTVPPPAAGPSENIRRKTLRDLAQKKRL